jgi:hypothetical protein
MGELVALASGVSLSEVVLSLVVENDVGALGGTANVRAEHEVVLGLSVEIGLVLLGSQLEVSTTAVNVLLVLHAELDNEILALVGE